MTSSRGQRNENILRDGSGGSGGSSTPLPRQTAAAIEGHCRVLVSDLARPIRWRNPAIYTTFASVNTVERVRMGSLGKAESLLQLTGNSTNDGTLRLEHIGNTPNIEILRATGTTSTNYNWNIMNDNAFKLQSKNLATAYATMFEMSGTGDVGIGTTPEVSVNYV